MRIERFAPVADQTTVRACYDIYLAAHHADDPGGPVMAAETFQGWIAQGWTCWPRQAALATDSAPTGWYLLDLPENSPHGLTLVTVVPSRRREGIGTALLRCAAQAARDHDRTQLGLQARTGSPGEAFAVAAGARSGMAESRYALDLTTLSRARLSQLRPRAAGYTLLRWTGPVPDEHLGQVAAINSALSDAPHDDVEEELHWDIQQVRNANQRILSRNLRCYSVAARHLASGKLVGLTQASVAPADASWGTQELTVVVGPHRGRRLGMLLKVALLQLLPEREPDLRLLITWTADSNVHMNAINRALGFEVLDRWTGFSLPLGVT